MSNSFRIIKYADFRDYIDAIAKLSYKDIHRKMVEQYEDHFFEYGHDWGYGDIEKHNVKPGVLLVDVQEDGVKFITKEFSFDEDLYREVLEQLKTSYVELHRTSPATYLESTLKDCLKRLSEAKKRIDKNSYFDNFDNYRRALQKIITKLKSDFEHLSGQEFKPDNILDTSLPDPEEVVKLYYKQGKSNIFGEFEVTTIMKLTRGFIIDNNLSDIRGYSESLFRDAKRTLEFLKSEGKIKKVPSRGAILNWINFYAANAGVYEKASHTNKPDNSPENM